MYDDGAVLADADLVVDGLGRGAGGVGGDAAELADQESEAVGVVDGVEPVDVAVAVAVAVDEGCDGAVGMRGDGVECAHAAAQAEGGELDVAVGGEDDVAALGDGVVAEGEGEWHGEVAVAVVLLAVAPGLGVDAGSVDDGLEVVDVVDEVVVGQRLRSGACRNASGEKQGK